MQPKPLGKAKQVHHRMPAKKQELQPEIDNENVSKIRASRYGRHTRNPRQSKFLSKTETEDFQIRKALNIYVREELEQQGRKTYFQRIFILARNIDFENIENSEMDLVYPKPKDYREYFQKRTDKIFQICEKKKSTNDSLGGLFICMETYTYLMIEGPEDMLADFFEELAVLHDKLWMESKVFLVEDKIGETYFNGFHTRRSAAINTNEKFPTATAEDINLMSSQHLKIKENIIKTAETLANQMLESEQDSSKEDTIQADPFILPADPYNKLLPEIQRIELILNANKFYRNVKDFALTYRTIPEQQDEDALFWPIQDNYTPMGIFERSAFDVNLTFGDYGKEVKQDENVS